MKTFMKLNDTLRKNIRKKAFEFFEDFLKKHNYINMLNLNDVKENDDIFCTGLQHNIIKVLPEKVIALYNENRENFIVTTYEELIKEDGLYEEYLKSIDIREYFYTNRIFEIIDFVRNSFDNMTYINFFNEYKYVSLDDELGKTIRMRLYKLFDSFIKENNLITSIEKQTYIHLRRINNYMFQNSIFRDIISNNMRIEYNKKYAALEEEIIFELTEKSGLEYRKEGKYNSPEFAVRRCWEIRAFVVEVLNNTLYADYLIEYVNNNHQISLNEELGKWITYKVVSVLLDFLKENNSLDLIYRNDISGDKKVLTNFFDCGKYKSLFSDNEELYKRWRFLYSNLLVQCGKSLFLEEGLYGLVKDINLASLPHKNDEHIDFTNEAVCVQRIKLISRFVKDTVDDITLNQIQIIRNQIDNGN